ncbi:MAG: hypothetical protein AAGK77_03535, partial [Pseudomonadota bacterium]
CTSPYHFSTAFRVIAPIAQAPCLVGEAQASHTAAVQVKVPQGLALRENTAYLIAEHGFAEYFDPRDGAPAGGGTFTWTAAVWLAWASPTQQGA